MAAGDMTVGDLFRSLSYGAFSNLALGLEGQGDVRETDKPRIVQLANDGLLRLYSQFILSEKELLLQMIEAVTHYRLDPAYALTGWDADADLAPHQPYIIDTVEEPFPGDLLRVLAVYNSLGQSFPLNDVEQIDSLFTPQPKLLQVPFPSAEAALSVVYQAKHPPLALDPIDPAQLIVLPEALHAALVAFIAEKVYGGMTTREALAKAAEHKAAFQEACLLAQALDLASTSTATTNSRFAKRGWV